jgi:hypothetical protein
MSRMQRVRRHRAGDSLANHDRARRLVSERLDGSLEPIEANWLNDHLAGCSSCRGVAAAYQADTMALRALRDRTPEPPRDLWARTSAAIEREAARGGGSRRNSAGRPRPALGVLSGIAVIAVVIGASVMSGGWLNAPVAVAPEPTVPAVAQGSPSARPGPTPIVVGAGSVGWVGTSTNGDLAYNVTNVNEVCPVERKPDCAEVTDGHSRQVDLKIRPKSISQSPVRNQAVVVGTDGSGSDTVVVIALPTAQPSASPVATPQQPSATPSTEPSETADASEPPASPTSEPPASESPRPPASPGETPGPTPGPTLAADLAIVSGVKVVGQSAAYSPDGAWFAFTARPSDGTTGPDIYVWRVGDALARPVTDDHASVFGSWAGRRLIGSRPKGVEGTADVAASSFLIDPATGSETALAAPVWRPIVDPEGLWAVVWDGTIRVDPDTHIPAPDKGSLVLRAYSRSDGVAIDGTADAVVDGDVSEFDVRWDETGTWLAIWIADATDPSIGRLSLIHLDPVSGIVDRPHGAPEDVTALPGFSISDGRLAWATPPGQSGEASRVQIVAWTDDSVGSVESGPITDAVIIH